MVQRVEDKLRPASSPHQVGAAAFRLISGGTGGVLVVQVISGAGVEYHLDGVVSRRPRR